MIASFERTGRPGLTMAWIACSVLALSCSPAETPDTKTATSAQKASAVERSPREMATEIDLSKDGLRAETRKGAAGSVEVTETRYYVGRTLVLVEEVLGSSEGGSSFAAYYFDDDRLMFFRGRGTRTFYVPDGEAQRENYDIELGYDFDGSVVDSKKIVNGEPAELEPLDYEAPKARARMIVGSNE